MPVAARLPGGAVWAPLAVVLKHRGTGVASLARPRGGLQRVDGRRALLSLHFQCRCQVLESSKPEPENQRLFGLLEAEIFVKVTRRGGLLRAWTSMRWFIVTTFSRDSGWDSGGV